MSERGHLTDILFFEINMLSILTCKAKAYITLTLKAICYVMYPDILLTMVFHYVLRIYTSSQISLTLRVICVLPFKVIHYLPRL